ncbi:exodeoxyribonuclease III [Uliginosibacterium sp. sgz301328]|uniref:exodeoxyribonuclease III n=1 Tax=Uliginosibacterium sp. sgz301328 TaxID=3243764 RepID=UPI00359D2D40
MKIATWNVNSLKVRLPHVLEWLAANQPDVLCLQELKCEDKAFPVEALVEAGYESAFFGQKTYNGVAILSRRPMTDVTFGIRGFDDEQRRVIAATVGDTRVVCAYFPNGQAPGTDKFAYKLSWLAALTGYLKEELESHPALVLAGDYNIAPDERDAHPDWKDEIHVSPPEREAFRALIGLGLTDAFRLFEQPERCYSWWDYRMFAFRRNFGLRIDHLLVSQPLVPAVKSCHVDKTPRALERPSDHAPVVVELT